MQGESAKRLCLILGGVRSGKSSFAEAQAAAHGGPVTYLATGRATDEEMRERITAHRRARPRDWRTIEAPENVPETLRQVSAQPGVVLLDCLTNFVANFMVTHPEEHYETPSPAQIRSMEARIAAATQELLAAYSSGSADLIIVSNEVGLGVVPPYPLGRVYRDALGRVNAAIAREADEVYWMIAGIAVRIKPDLESHHGGHHAD